MPISNLCPTNAVEFKPDLTCRIHGKERIFNLENISVMGDGWRETIALVHIQVRYHGLH
jgi:hypothetical protein